MREDEALHYLAEVMIRYLDTNYPGWVERAKKVTEDD